jgi:D-amino-acid dehydrogenase
MESVRWRGAEAARVAGSHAAAELPPPVTSDVLVLGAGVVGVATAEALVRRGLSVTLVDRAQGPGRGASFANGGQLSYSYTDALASPSLLKRLPGILAATDPAFRVAVRFDPDYLRWCLAFFANGSAGRFAANSLAGLDHRAALTRADGGAARPASDRLRARCRASCCCTKMRSAFAPPPPMRTQAQGGHRRARALDPEEVVRWSRRWPTSAPAGRRHLRAGRRGRRPAPVLRRAGPALARGGLADSLWQPRSRPSRPETSRRFGWRAGAAGGALTWWSRPVPKRGLLRAVGWRVPIVPVRGHSLTLPPDARRRGSASPTLRASSSSADWASGCGSPAWPTSASPARRSTPTDCRP